LALSGCTSFGMKNATVIATPYRPLPSRAVEG
jgi:hypothetical protein